MDKSLTSGNYPYVIYDIFRYLSNKELMEKATVCKDWYTVTSKTRSFEKLNLNKCVEESICNNRIIFLYDPESVEWAIKSPRRYQEIKCRVEDTPGRNEPRTLQAEEYDSDNSDMTQPNLIDLYAQTNCNQVAKIITNNFFSLTKLDITFDYTNDNSKIRNALKKCEKLKEIIITIGLNENAETTKGILKTIIEDISTIRKIEIRGTHNSTGLRGKFLNIKKNPQVKEIEIKNSRFKSRNWIKLIAKCPNLERLLIQNCSLEKQTEINALASSLAKNNTQLKTLEIKMTINLPKITIPSVENVIIANPSMTFNIIPFLQANPQIKTLKLEVYFHKENKHIFKKIIETIELELLVILSTPGTLHRLLNTCVLMSPDVKIKRIFFNSYGGQQWQYPAMICRNQITPRG